MPLDTALGRSPGGTQKSSCREVRPPGAGKSSDFNWKPGVTVAVGCNPPAPLENNRLRDPVDKPSCSSNRIILTTRSLEIDASGSTRGLDFSLASDSPALHRGPASFKITVNLLPRWPWGNNPLTSDRLVASLSEVCGPVRDGIPTAVAINIEHPDSAAEQADSGDPVADPVADDRHVSSQSFKRRSFVRSRVELEIAVEVEIERAAPVDANLLGSLSGPVADEGLVALSSEGARTVFGRAVPDPVPVQVQQPETLAEHADLCRSGSVPVSQDRRVTRGAEGSRPIESRVPGQVAVHIQKPSAVAEDPDLRPAGAIPVANHRHIAIGSKTTVAIDGRSVPYAVAVEIEEPLAAPKDSDGQRPGAIPIAKHRDVAGNPEHGNRNLGRRFP